ncbi:hypothetical protein D3C73_898430 [compost metagenome]
MKHRAGSGETIGKPPGKGQRIDVPATAVEHAAIPVSRADEIGSLGRIEQANRRTAARPGFHATCREPHAPRRMRRLKPAVLLRLAIDLMSAHHIEKIGSAIADKLGKPLPGLPMGFRNAVRFGTGHGRNDLAVIAAGRPPADLDSLEHDNLVPALGKMKSGRKAGKAGSDDRNPCPRLA